MVALNTLDSSSTRLYDPQSTLGATLKDECPYSNYIRIQGKITRVNHQRTKINNYIHETSLQTSLYLHRWQSAATVTILYFSNYVRHEQIWDFITKCPILSFFFGN